jgi:lipopolysaccharide export system permease protein
LGALDRYLLRQILLPFAFATASVVTLVLLLQVRRLGSAALGMGLGLGDLLVILSASLPAFLVIVVPLAFLTSVMVGLGRMQADRELLAVRAAGASPWRIARVPALLGLGFGLLALPLAHYVGPYGMSLLRQTLADVGLKNVSQAIRPGVFNESLEGMTLYAKSQSADGTLGGVLAHDRRDPSHPVLVIAESGRLLPEDGQLSLELRRGEAHLQSETARYDRIGFGRASLAIDVREQIKQRTKFLGLSQTLASSQIWEMMHNEPRSSLDVRRTERDFWRRSAHPMMVLIFGLLGAAIAIRGWPQRPVLRVVLALASVVAYYLLGRVADYWVTENIGTPALAVFAPNIVLLIVAVVGLSWPART